MERGGKNKSKKELSKWSAINWDTEKRLTAKTREAAKMRLGKIIDELRMQGCLRFGQRGRSKPEIRRFKEGYRREGKSEFRKEKSHGAWGLRHILEQVCSITHQKGEHLRLRFQARGGKGGSRW